MIKTDRITPYPFDEAPPSLASKLAEASELQRQFPNMQVMVSAENSVYEVKNTGRLAVPVSQVVFDRSTHEPSQPAIRVLQSRRQILQKMRRLNGRPRP